MNGLLLPSPSDAVDQACVNLVLARSGGVTGRIALILSRAAELSIRKGQEFIDARWIDQASRSLDLATIEPA